MGVLKVITGGELGKSAGKSNFAVKNPPSYKVSGGPTINSSQLKIFSSSPRPTDTPSGGFLAKSAHQKKEKRLGYPTSLHYFAQTKNLPIYWRRSNSAAYDDIFIENL
jgi:hypothetical protein